MIVLAAGPEEHSGRPRPFLVVQSDLFNQAHASISLCPMSSHIGGQALFRIAFSPTPDTGLCMESEVQVDKVQTLRRDRIVSIVGRAPATAMEQVDQALRRWFEL